MSQRSRDENDNLARIAELENALRFIYSMFEAYGLCDEAKRACENCENNVMRVRNTAAKVLGYPEKVIVEC